MASDFTISGKIKVDGKDVEKAQKGVVALFEGMKRGFKESSEEASDFGRDLTKGLSPALIIAQGVAAAIQKLAGAIGNALMANENFAKSWNSLTNTLNKALARTLAPVSDWFANIINSAIGGRARIEELGEAVVAAQEKFGKGSQSEAKSRLDYLNGLVEETKKEIAQEEKNIASLEAAWERPMIRSREAFLDHQKALSDANEKLQGYKDTLGSLYNDLDEITTKGVALTQEEADARSELEKAYMQSLEVARLYYKYSDKGEQAQIDNIQRQIQAIETYRAGIAKLLSTTEKDNADLVDLFVKLGKDYDDLIKQQERLTKVAVPAQEKVKEATKETVDITQKLLDLDRAAFDIGSRNALAQTDSLAQRQKYEKSILEAQQARERIAQYVYERENEIVGEQKEELDLALKNKQAQEDTALAIKQKGEREKEAEDAAKAADESAKEARENALSVAESGVGIASSIVSIMNQSVDDEIEEINEKLEIEQEKIDEWLEERRELLEAERQAALEAAGLGVTTTEEGMAASLQAAIESGDERAIYLEEQRQKELKINQEYDAREEKAEKEADAKKKAEQKKAAQETAEIQYKAALNDYFIQVAQAGVAVASSIIYSINHGAFAGGLTGAAIAAAAQTAMSVAALAAVIAAIPQKPSVAFADGGVINKPTKFRYASGGAVQDAVMGEAGSEAIMPLTRLANGDLGVQAAGTVSSQQVNYASLADLYNTFIKVYNGKKLEGQLEVF